MLNILRIFNQYFNKQSHTLRLISNLWKEDIFMYEAHKKKDNLNIQACPWDITFSSQII